MKKFTLVHYNSQDSSLCQGAPAQRPISVWDSGCWQQSGRHHRSSPKALILGPAAREAFFPSPAQKETAPPQLWTPILARVCCKGHAKFKKKNTRQGLKASVLFAAFIFPTASGSSQRLLDTHNTRIEVCNCRWGRDSASTLQLFTASAYNHPDKSRPETAASF